MKAIKHTPEQPIEARTRIVLLHDTVLENVGFLPHGSVGTVVSVHDEDAEVLFEDPIKILFTLARDEFEAAPELPVQARRRPDSIVGDIIRSRTVVPRADVLSESVDARLRGAPPATAAPTPHPLD